MTTLSFFFLPFNTFYKELTNSLIGTVLQSLINTFVIHYFKNSEKKRTRFGSLKKESLHSTLQRKKNVPKMQGDQKIMVQETIGKIFKRKIRRFSKFSQ